ncbi:MAG TPA: hypothetical protein VFS33_08975 [Gemmatimonadales bacterium]|nr:hypothetical protein [Gemmatimonadales bacterium]
MRLVPYVVAIALVGCAPSAGPRGATPAAGGSAALANAESTYADLRAVRDRIDITRATGRSVSPDGVPLDSLTRRYNRVRGALEPRLAAIDSTALAGEDRRALATMRRALAHDLTPLDATVAASDDPATAPECAYDARAIAASSGGLDSLQRRIYACYGWAAHHVVVDGEARDRLTILGDLAREADSARRRQLFLAMDPMWRTMNRDNGPESPFRVLMAAGAKARPAGETTATPRARALGIAPDSVERWLVSILETWKASTPDSALEPWDWYYAAGRASRALSSRVPRERLDSLNAQVYRALGADIAALRVHFDLAPREGKTPVAFTTFGARAHRTASGWTPAEPWIFATYQVGGLDNLNELLHETGHAVHIAAVHTRPAFADWPDSDPFTEGLADFVALDVFEPAWQQRWLGDSVPLADGLRARYAGIVMDVAWSLFELRMQRDPSANPNQVWSDITGDYLRIRPHPELSWWAARGQLVDSPGYMLNYAVGAILIADIRARTRELHGPFVAGDPGWYSWVAPRLFRFGLERPSREVITEFLGRPVSPGALLADLRRMR